MHTPPPTPTQVLQSTGSPALLSVMWFSLHSQQRGTCLFCALLALVQSVCTAHSRPHTPRCVLRWGDAPRGERPSHFRRERSCGLRIQDPTFMPPSWLLPPASLGFRQTHLNSEKQNAVFFNHFILKMGERMQS